MSLFPFTVKADDHIGSVGGGFRKIFLNHRTDATWYTADVIVHSFTEIEFIVLDMAVDNFCGGVGDEIYRVTATVTAEETTLVTSQEAIRVADRQLQAEIRQAHLVKVNKRALELMAASGLDIEAV
jgi:hypothetical protein